MTIKKQLKAIMDELEKPQAEINKARFAAQLATLAADLEDDSTEVPANVLEPLNNEMRKMAVMGFASLVMQTIFER